VILFNDVVEIVSLDGGKPNRLYLLIVKADRYSLGRLTLSERLGREAAFARLEQRIT
jgi:hypothetical protein